MNGITGECDCGINDAFNFNKPNHYQEKGQNVRNLRALLGFGYWIGGRFGNIWGICGHTNTIPNALEKYADPFCGDAGVAASTWWIR